MTSEAELIQRLFSHAEIGPPDECWEWQGSRAESGHGRFWVDGRVERAHRVAYRLFVGPIPGTEVVRHMCDNPPCINPNHLVSGTYVDNHQDMLQRNRSGRTKLSPDQVVDVRERLAMGMPVNEVAIQYNLSEKHVGRIERRDVWKNAEGFETNSTRYGDDVPF